MKSKSSTLVILFSLFFLLLSSVAVSVCAASVVPEGFVGIPWGANRDQIIKTMNERGYTTEGTIFSRETLPSTLLFKGAFGGQKCQLEFYLSNNTFYIASASHMGMFDQERYNEQIYKQMVQQISLKYGLPQSDKITEYNDNTGKIHRSGVASWDIIDSESADKYVIRIDLIPTDVVWLGDKSFGFVNVTYTAVSLGERLNKKEF